MERLTHFPGAVFVVSLLSLWISTRLGVLLQQRRGKMDEEERGDHDVILASTLTLLGLIIGFSFGMAVSRYDLRKGYEAQEATLIAMEYTRADMMPAAGAANVKELLTRYLRQRILFYGTRNGERRRQIDSETAQLDAKLWSAVRAYATDKPTPVTGLVVSGLNDVLNTQGLARAAWRNRIPASAWILMVAIAVCSNLLIGYGARRTGKGTLLLLVVPIVISVSFFLISDIDSPSGGLIRIQGDNLERLADSLKAR